MAILLAVHLTDQYELASQLADMLQSERGFFGTSRTKINKAFGHVVSNMSLLRHWMTLDDTFV